MKNNKTYETDQPLKKKNEPRDHLNIKDLRNFKKNERKLFVQWKKKNLS